MKWLKRWTPAPAPASPIEAQRAKVRAQRELEEARRQRPEVDRVTQRLQQLLTRNGFGPAIERAMQRKERT